MAAKHRACLLGKLYGGLHRTVNVYSTFSCSISNVLSVLTDREGLTVMYICWLVC